VPTWRIVVRGRFYNCVPLHVIVLRIGIDKRYGDIIANVKNNLTMIYHYASESKDLCVLIGPNEFLGLLRSRFDRALVIFRNAVFANVSLSFGEWHVMLTRLVQSCIRDLVQ